MEKKSTMLGGALLLTAGSLGLRVMQLVFQIYISGVLGAPGLGRMQLVLAVGSFAGVLGAGGVRVAAAYLTARAAGLGDQRAVGTAMVCCGVYGGALSLLAAAGLWALAEPIAVYILGDLGGILSLRLYALFLPVGVLGAVLGGWYTAMGRIQTLVASELLERMGAILLVVGLVTWNIPRDDPCAGVILGTGLASVGCLGWLLRGYLRWAGGRPVGSVREMMGRLVRLAAPLGLGDLLRSGLGALENLLIPWGLRQGGRDTEGAMGAYGTVSGMVFPVITFPSIILYAIGDLLVPEMARCQAKNRWERVRFLADKCLRLTVVLGACWAGLCLGLGRELGQLLFGSGVAGAYICCFSLLVLILYPDAITDGILKGLGQQLHSVRYNTITSVIDLGLLAILLPRYGMGGFLGAFTVSHGVNFYLSIRRLLVVTGYRPELGRLWRTGVALGAGLWVLHFWPGDGSLMGVCAGTGVYLGVFWAAAVVTGALRREDIRWLHTLWKGMKK